MKSFFPLFDKDYLSILSPAGVESASAKRVGENRVVTIKLKQEKGKDIQFVPTYHAQYMDIVPFGDLSAGFDEIGMKPTIAYNKGTINAVINPQGKLVSLKLFQPIEMNGSALIFLLTINMKVKNDWTVDMTFDYFDEVVPEATTEVPTTLAPETTVAPTDAPVG